MFAHGVEGFLGVASLEGGQEGLVGDEGAGLGVAGGEVETPEAQVVQENAVGGVLQEGVVDDVGEVAVDALVVL